MQLTREKAAVREQGSIGGGLLGAAICYWAAHKDVLSSCWNELPLLQMSPGQWWIHLNWS